MASSTARQTRPSGSLSPQQQFRNRVRGLTSEDHPRCHRRNKSISLNYNPYERQHGSNLSVQASVGRVARRSPAAVAVRPLQGVREEPDFVLEERQAWSRRSPETNNHRRLRGSDLPFQLYDDETSDCHDGQVPETLKPFAPLRQITDADTRPKTSRGIEESQPQVNRHETDPVSSLHSASSRFLEGSMTSRSQAVATSWTTNPPEYYTSDSEVDDSETTPKATECRGSSSVNSQDSGPVLDGTSPVRRTLFRKKSSNMTPGTVLPSRKKEREKERKPKERNAKTGRRGLRKSLSSWSLHNIGEKIGLFTDLSSNSDNDAEEQRLGSDKREQELDSVVDERKRKAEVAYAQQLSTKKQKDNSGSATAGAGQLTRQNQRETDSHLAAGGQVDSDPDATIRARPGTRTRRRSLGPFMVSAFSQPEPSAEHDARKRPSRRELEKENQQLREMLRRSQAPNKTSNPPILVPPCSQPELLVGPPRINTLHLRDNIKVAPPLRRSSQRIPLQNMSNSLQVGPSTTQKLNPEVFISPSMENAPDLRVPIGVSSPLGSLPHMSLPGLPRTVGSITEEPESEGDDSKGMCTTAKFTPSYAARLRRRHSAHSADPQKRPGRVAKENCRMSLSAAVPTIVIDQAASERSMTQADWKGWDDDVF